MQWNSALRSVLAAGASIALLTAGSCLEPTSAGSSKGPIDGTYDLSASWVTQSGLISTYFVQAGYVTIKNGHITSTDGKLVGDVLDDMGNLSVQGPCPTGNFPSATWTNFVTPYSNPKGGTGTWKCNGVGAVSLPGNSWRLYNGH